VGRIDAEGVLLILRGRTTEGVYKKKKPAPSSTVWLLREAHRGKDSQGGGVFEPSTKIEGGMLRRNRSRKREEATEEFG